MTRVFLLAILPVFAAACCTVARATGDLSDMQLSSLVIEANAKLNAGKIDEAIDLLKSRISDADDRLVTLPSGNRVSAAQVLGTAYWGKRDPANTLRYLQRVAYRIPVDEDNVIPGVVLACRRILAGQGKVQSIDPSTLINNRCLAKTFLTEDGTVYASVQRIAQATGGTSRKVGDSLMFSVGGTVVEIPLSKVAPARSQPVSHRYRQVPGILRQGEVMVPIRAFARALGGNARWDSRSRLAVASLPSIAGMRS